MSSWVSSNFAVHATEFSPFHGDLLLMGAAQYYGITGNGKAQVFLFQNGQWVPQVEFLTQDGVYDVAWSEENEHVFASCQGDGTLKIFDVKQPRGPLLSIRAHEQEVYAVHWNCHIRNLLCTASWDKSNAVFDLNTGQVTTRYRSHTSVGYHACWSPHHGTMFASVGGDGCLFIYDLKTPANTRPAQAIQAHQFEVLSGDWSKYDQNQFLTGSIDKTIRVWDLRKNNAPLATLFGHQLAVRRIKTHPHKPQLVGSVSYDMSVKMWDLSIMQLVQSFDHHQEFVIGLDFSLFEAGLMVSGSWDRTMCIWNHERGPPMPCPFPKLAGNGPAGSAAAAVGKGKA
ncbi:unnamed protein product [Amoebophrya sp. A120]|nr:unnamed protein product [Amoebophrya sp. A120]|eukprot:GSA120T00011203001.1